MAADGSLKFDTKIDINGFSDGLSTLEKAMDRLTDAVTRLSGNIAKCFSGLETSAGQAAEKTGTAKESIDGIADAAKRAEQETANLKKQMDDITVSRMQDTDSVPLEERREPMEDPGMYGYDESAQRFVDEYAQGVEQADSHTNEFKQTIGELQAKIKELESNGFYFGDDEYDDAYMALAKVKNALSDYKKEMLSPAPDAAVPVDTESFQGKVDALKRQMKEMEQQGKTFGDPLYDSVYQALNKAQAQLAEYKKGLTEPAVIPVKLDANSFEGQKQRLKQELSGLEKRGITLGNPEYDSVYSALQRVTQAENDYRKSLVQADAGQKTVKKSADGMKQAMDGVSKSTGGAKKGMTMLGMLGRSILFSFVFRAIGAVSTAVKEGFQNLAQYSGGTNATLSSLMSSLTYLKNSFAAAFAPILDFAVPALNALIGAIAQAVMWVGQLIASLTGKGTFVKAVKVNEDYAAGLKKTGGAAKQAGKDAKKALAPFDELNILQENSGGDSGGGSGGGGGADPSQMFETVTIENSFEKLSRMLDPVINKLRECAALFKSGFADGLGNWKGQISDIKSNLASIGKSLKDIFLDKDVLSAADGYLDAFAYAAGQQAGAFASIGLTIAQNIIGGISKYLEQYSGTIKQWLIDMFNIGAATETIKGNLAVSLADILSVFGGENGQQVTANIIAIFTNAFMGVVELAAKFGRDILDIIADPIIQNGDEIKLAFDGILGVVEQVTGTIAQLVTDSFEKMNEVYDEHLSPMFQAFKEGLTEIVETALEAFNTHILPAFQYAAEKFQEFKDRYLQPLIDKFLDFFGKVADGISEIWTETLAPFVNWAIDTFAPIIGKAIKTASDSFFTFMGTVSEVAGYILDALGGVIDFVTGVFTGDWDKAWNGVKSVFKGVFNGIIVLLEDAINYMVKGLNRFTFDVPDWIPGVGGETFGFNIGTISLPRLASGTVVPPRAGEFAAILGDNNREAEVVSPLSTMKQAFREVAGEFGNGGGDINLSVYLDGKTIYEDVVKRTKMAKKQMGMNPLLA